MMYMKFVTLYKLIYKRLWYLVFQYMDYLSLTQVYLCNEVMWYLVINTQNVTLNSIIFKKVSDSGMI